MYKPMVDDYVIWGKHKGWVYFVDDMYITIEVAIKPKPICKHTRIETHKYIHTLLVCNYWNWNQLEYVYTRKNKYGKNLEDMKVFTRKF